jgi:hypothetical protein
MRDKGLDKGLIRYFDDSERTKRGWNQGFFGFRKMFRDYLTKLNVPFYDVCCPALTGDIYPVRYNDATNNLERYNGTAWVVVDGGALVSDSLSLDDGTAAAPALRLGADTNNGLYGVSDTVVGVAVEGAQAATFSATSMAVNGVTNLAGTQIAGFFPLTAAQSITGAGAVNVTSYLTKVTSSGVADALTIASGTVIGQRKKVQHVVDGGSAVLTGVFTGGTTITFTAVAEFADLLWTGTEWAVLELGNTAAPGTPPVLA